MSARARGGKVRRGARAGHGGARTVHQEGRLSGRSAPSRLHSLASRRKGSAIAWPRSSAASTLAAVDIATGARLAGSSWRSASRGTSGELMKEKATCGRGEEAPASETSKAASIWSALCWVPLHPPLREIERPFLFASASKEQIAQRSTLGSWARLARASGEGPERSDRGVLLTRDRESVTSPLIYHKTSYTLIGKCHSLTQAERTRNREAARRAAQKASLGGLMGMDAFPLRTPLSASHRTSSAGPAARAAPIGRGTVLSVGRSLSRSGRRLSRSPP